MSSADSPVTTTSVYIPGLPGLFGMYRGHWVHTALVHTGRSGMYRSGMPRHPLLSLRVSSSELASWKAHAVHTGVSVSELVRAVVNESVVDLAPSTPFPAVRDGVNEATVVVAPSTPFPSLPAFTIGRTTACPHRTPAGAWCRHCD